MVNLDVWCMKNLMKDAYRYRDQTFFAGWGGGRILLHTEDNLYSLRKRNIPL